MSCLHRFVQDLCRTGGSWFGRRSEVNEFDLVRVDPVVNNHNSVIVYEHAMKQLGIKRKCGGTKFNYEWENFRSDQLQVLFSLRDCFQELPPGGNTLVRTLYTYHGCRREHVEDICRDGLVPLQTSDDGYFGLGCYSSLNIEYALRYSRGDFAEDALQPPADGLYPVIMLSACVGTAYPITPRENYGANAIIRNGTSYSNFFGRPLATGFDSHVACVNEESGFQAVDKSSCQYVELISGHSSQLLPIAVLWFKLRRSP